MKPVMIARQTIVIALCTAALGAMIWADEKGREERWAATMAEVRRNPPRTVAQVVDALQAEVDALKAQVAELQARTRITIPPMTDNTYDLGEVTQPWLSDIAVVTYCTQVGSQQVSHTGDHDDRSCRGWLVFPEGSAP